VNSAPHPIPRDAHRAFEDRIGYHFGDGELLIRALTHSSIRTTWSTSNERLEFLGDAILGAVVSLHLYASHPEFQEGVMTRVKSRIVSRRSLARKARELDLAPLLRVGRMFPTPADITDSIISNALEAVIAAVFLDGGLEAAYAVVMNVFDEGLRAAAEQPGRRDYKSALVQWAQQTRDGSPQYELLSMAGPDHTRTFELCVRIGERAFPPAWGRSKKEAEQRAARSALVELGLL
jgi:ribonuclease-3